MIELPSAYAVANAERFAKGGVDTAKLFSCVEYLAFGCEDDDLELLTKAAFARDDKNVKEIIAKRMDGGDYYPRAYEYAVRQVFGDNIAEVITKPNNILAAEYIRALDGSGIKPLPVKRKGAQHDSDITDGEYASASYIRRSRRTFFLALPVFFSAIKHHVLFNICHCFLYYITLRASYQLLFQKIITEFDQFIAIRRIVWYNRVTEINNSIP